jgi:hypothetical protein
MSARRALVIIIALGCSRPQPVEPVAPDPSTKPLAPAPPPMPVKPFSERACEPVVHCGVWSDCVWLEHLDDNRYRALGGDEKGEIFVRRKECWPADAGQSGCAVHCSGADGGPPCIDGLHPEKETCTGAAVPKPSTKKCQFGAGVCGSLL